MAAMLRARRISGWQMHRKDVIGKPDFYFADLRIALFIDGCFWHACPKCSQMPRQNAAFWSVKLAENARRDVRTRRALNRAGISVIRLWEHDLEKLTPRCRSVLNKLRISCAAEAGPREIGVTGAMGDVSSPARSLPPRLR